MDEDLDVMTVEELKSEVIKLRQGIRAHRDSQGHDLCWFVPELWALVKDNVNPSPKVPNFCEFIENCTKYRKSLGE